jgi:hypothetical protein
MGTVNVPNTSVVYSNPKQIDQTSNLDPTTGATWTPGNQPYSFTVPSSPPTFKVGFTPLTPGTQATTTTGSNPQPGTFDPTPPKANPVVVNQDPPVPGKGQPVSVQGSSGSTGVPTTDVNRQVSGQVPGGPVFRNPA